MASPTHVRTLGATAILSLVVHGAALAWVIGTPKPEAPPPVAAAPPPPLEVITEVEYLPDPELAAPPTRGEPTTVARAGTPRRAAVTVSATPHVEVAPPVVEPPVVAPPKPQLQPPTRRLAMRTGPQVPSVSEQLAAAALDHPDTTVLPDYPGLRTEVALDAARHRLRAGDREALEEVVGLEDAQKAEELKLQRDGTYRTDKTTFVAKVAPDGTVKLHDKQNLHREGLGARFDVTDWIMRSRGIDPYASAKLEYLDRTRDQRVEIAKAYRKEQLSHSATLMQANLERLWATTPDLAARKDIVFELWEDCAETGEPELVDGGAAARALLVRFVQLKLRGPDGYTAEELAKLNAHRRSKAEFDPYHELGKGV